MDQTAKLVIVTGSGRSAELGKNVHKILRENYSLDDRVEIIKSLPAARLTNEQKDVKDRTRPLVVDRFDDSEVYTEMGKDMLLRRLRGAHIAFVKYLFDPDEGGIHVNRHLFEVGAFFRLLRDHLKNRGEADKFTLVAPYLTYLRMHRVDEYIENNEFYQSNTLELMVDFLNLSGVDEILTIDPHAKEVAKYCETVGIGFSGHNPFSSSRYINWAKLGFSKKEQALPVLRDLQPFISYYEDHKEDYKDAAVVAPDDGSELRSEHYAVDTGLDFESLTYMNKKRLGAGKIKLLGIKDFSLIKPENVKGRICIIPDDMISSGNTADEIGAYLKNLGATRVELWVTHAVCPKVDKIEQLKNIDKIVTLDTIVRNHPKIYQIPATAQIMSALLYKSYSRGLT